MPNEQTIECCNTEMEKNKEQSQTWCPWSVWINHILTWSWCWNTHKHEWTKSCKWLSKYDRHEDKKGRNQECGLACGYCVCPCVWSHSFLPSLQQWSCPPACWFSPPRALCSNLAHVSQGPVLPGIHTSAWFYEPLYPCKTITHEHCIRDNATHQSLACGRVPLIFDVTGGIIIHMLFSGSGQE